MGFLDYFKRSAKSASVAKDRLQIIVARERTVTRGNAIDYLPQLQQELLQVIAKYELIDLGQVSVSVDKSGGCEVLELNVVLSPPKPKPLPEPAAATVTASATP
jgi:cell division topological specificity factor